MIVPRVCLLLVQKETLILRRIAELLRDQQSAIAHGAATADFDRDACGRHRARDRDLTSEILGWACLRRDFETSADFLRSALIAEIRQVSGDVDAMILTFESLLYSLNLARTQTLWIWRQDERQHVVG